MKLTLNKSISATRLNPKSGVPYSEPEANIPFGAIVDYKGPDRDMEKFTYLVELYRCPRDVLKSAIDGGKLPNLEEHEDAPAGAPSAAPVKAPEPTLKFEKLLSAPFPVSRAKVPGGWLVVAAGSSLTFYPDPQHAWNGESL